MSSKVGAQLLVGGGDIRLPDEGLRAWAQKRGAHGSAPQYDM
jgi:hypothetical protein